MRRWLKLAVGLLVGMAAFWFWYRRRTPCPAAHKSILENRFLERTAAPETLLDRAGLDVGMRVLDAGCGPGRITIAAARRVGAGGEVVAADVWPEMLTDLEQRVRAEALRNVRFLLADLSDATEQHLPSAWFDRALMVTTLGELAAPEAALSAIYDALKPGGMLSITEALPDPHYRSQGAVRRMARFVGFEVLRTYGSPLAYTINLIKPNGNSQQRTHRDTT